MDQHPVRVLSLCSGAGGLDLGLRLALPAARTVCYVERDRDAVRVLGARMRDGWLDCAPIWDDITTFDATAWRGAVDLVLAGFPCQPVSVAGKRRAHADERWLWDDVARIYADSGAQWVALENVRGLVSLGLDRVLGTLADLGCAAEWMCLRASEVGAPHRRDRWFCVAYRERERPQRGVETGTTAPTTGLGRRALADGTRDRRHEGGSEPAGQLWRSHVVERGEQVGDAVSARLPGGEVDRGAGGGPRESGRRHVQSTRADGAMGAFAWPPGPAAREEWGRIIRARPDLAPAVATQPAVRRVADGLAHRMDISRAARLRLCGNGVVPAQAGTALRELFERLKRSIT